MKTDFLSQLKSTLFLSINLEAKLRVVGCCDVLGYIVRRLVFLGFAILRPTFEIMIGAEEDNKVSPAIVFLSQNSSLLLLGMPPVSSGIHSTCACFSCSLRLFKLNVSRSIVLKKLDNN